VNSSESHFSVKLLLDKLTRLPSPSKYWVGFSGGADSTALLQAMYECRDHLEAPVHAIHFHHGLQEAASAWQEHCESFCMARDIPIQSEKLEINPEGRGSLEEESRNCRYRAVANARKRHRRTGRNTGVAKS
jgi:tRNA(Ile)-lysidine synthase